MLTPESVRKKLENLQPTQESVETVSLWCLHHRDSAALIVAAWLEILKNAGSEKQRLSLFYLANDVCQKGRKRKGHDYLTVFVQALKEAFLLSRLDSTRQNIERILNIWEERGVFDASVIKDFRSILETSTSSANASSDISVVETQSTTAVDDKIITDFNLSTLIGDVEKYQKGVETIERLRAVLPSTSMADGSMKPMLKGRQEGQRHYEDVHQAYKKWTEFVDECERRLKKHHHFIIALERAQIFYETQLNEAGIVQTAYEKFGNGVKEVRERLSKMQSTGDYKYVASPIADAPSPSPYDDPFIEQLEAVVASKKEGDKLETVDMDLDDDVKFSTMPDSSRTTITHETAIGGMKLATNQSFLNDPSSVVASNGGTFSISSPPKKVKLDPRQQKNSHPATPSLTIDHSILHPIQPNYPANTISPTPSAVPGWPLPPSQPGHSIHPANTYPPPVYGPGMNAHPTSPVTLPHSAPVVGFQGQHTNYGTCAPVPPPPPPFGVDTRPQPGTSVDSSGAVFEYDHGMSTAQVVGTPMPASVPPVRRGSNANNLTVLTSGVPNDHYPKPAIPNLMDVKMPVNRVHADPMHYEPGNLCYGGRPVPTDPRQYRPIGRGGHHGIADNGRYSS